MADIFLSFSTHDTARVQVVYNALVQGGMSVFWSNSIPLGAVNYQAVIEDELRKATVVLVLWTHNSVSSGPVAQESLQAQLDEKLIQVILDHGIPPIRYPMEISFKAEKVVLFDWVGHTQDPEWIRLRDALAARLMLRLPPSTKSSAGGNRNLLGKLKSSKERLMSMKERHRDYAYRRLISVLGRIPDGVSLSGHVPVQGDFGREVKVEEALNPSTFLRDISFREEEQEIVMRAFRHFGRTPPSNDIHDCCRELLLIMSR